jgi:hypothetical protein
MGRGGQGAIRTGGAKCTIATWALAGPSLIRTQFPFEMFRDSFVLVSELRSARPYQFFICRPPSPAVSIDLH